jgi:hypothetical protein
MVVVNPSVVDTGSLSAGAVPAAIAGVPSTVALASWAPGFVALRVTVAMVPGSSPVTVTMPSAMTTSPAVVVTA